MTIDEFRGDSKYLSNFYVRPLQIGKHRYHSVEQYFQSRKCAFLEDWQEVMTTTYPAQSKKIGSAVELRDDWEAIKLGVMRKALAAKFNVEEDLGERLIATGAHLIVEGNVWHDNYWGDCRCGRKECKKPGENWLGHLLMARRCEIRAEKLFDISHATPVGGIMDHPDVKAHDEAERRRARSVERAASRRRR